MSRERAGGFRGVQERHWRSPTSRGVEYMRCRDRDELLLFGVLAQRGAGINFFSLLVDRTLLYSTASTIDVQGRCREMVMPALLTAVAGSGFTDSGSTDDGLEAPCKTVYFIQGRHGLELAGPVSLLQCRAGEFNADLH